MSAGRLWVAATPTMRWPDEPQARAEVAGAARPAARTRTFKLDDSDDMRTPRTKLPGIDLARRRAVSRVPKRG